MGVGQHGRKNKTQLIVKKDFKLYTEKYLKDILPCPEPKDPIYF